jgi:hypothetical protein
MPSPVSRRAPNPFAKETYNMTLAGHLIKTNPAKAARLAEAAGVKL